MIIDGHKDYLEAVFVDHLKKKKEKERKKMFPLVYFCIIFYQNTILCILATSNKICEDTIDQGIWITHYDKTSNSVQACSVSDFPPKQFKLILHNCVSGYEQ